MPLPQISTPTYELTIPSSKKKIKYRPFLVREEKILILALESENEKQIADAIKSTLKSCIITRGTKIDSLSTFDIEYIFLNIRGKSVGESIDLLVTCPDDGETKVETKVYIDEIKVKIDDKHSPDIKLDDSLTLRMRYPAIDEFVKNNFDFKSEDEETIEKSFELIASCIDVVYNQDESWAASDCTKKELNDWLGSLDSRQFKEIELFFQTMPRLSHTIKVTNPNTKVESEVTLEGISNFFE
tara:strand:- start:4679 stop:5404 length:726 start_codon:yes stop_codon:yes gene_type:complete